MSRIFSIVIAVTAAVSVLAAPVPIDNALDIRAFPDEAIDLATRDDLDDLDRRGKFGKFKNVVSRVAKVGISLAAKSNPAFGIAAKVASGVARGRGGKLGGALQTAAGLFGRDEEEDEVLLRDVEDELALRDEEPTELEIRDLDDEELALAARDYLDSLSDMERRNFFKKAGGFFKKAAGAVRGVTSNPAFGTALNLAGQFGGSRGRAVSRIGGQVSRAASLFRREEDELELRDVSDEDLALVARAAWEEMSEEERRGFGDFFTSAVNKVKSAVGSVKNFAGTYANPARQVLGVASSIAAKAGGARGRGVAGKLRAANNAVGRANRAISAFRRDIEDEE